MSEKKNWWVEVIEKYCCNEVTQYQITSTDGKPEKRTFDSGCHIQTEKLADALRTELIKRLVKECREALSKENVIAASVKKNRWPRIRWIGLLK